MDENQMTPEQIANIKRAYEDMESLVAESEAVRDRLAKTVSRIHEGYRTVDRSTLEHLQVHLDIANAHLRAQTEARQALRGWLIGQGVDPDDKE